MGIGDEIMALARAQAYARERPELGPVAILGSEGRQRSHELWQPCVHVAKLGQSWQRSITDGPGARPYIDYPRTTQTRWAFRTEHRPMRANLDWIAPDERARDCVLIEPTIKASASPNKQWHGWQSMVDLRRDVKWAQLGTHGTRYLHGVLPLPAHSFIEVAALIRAARLVICHEGALHHAAAAFATLAVVLVGAYIPVGVTTYPGQKVLAVDDRDAVGWRVPNQRCAQAWKQITPRAVLTALPL